MMKYQKQLANLWGRPPSAKSPKDLVSGRNIKMQTKNKGESFIKCEVT